MCVLELIPLLTALQQYFNAYLLMMMWWWWFVYCVVNIYRNFSHNWICPYTRWKRFQSTTDMDNMKMFSHLLFSFVSHHAHTGQSLSFFVSSSIQIRGWNKTMTNHIYCSFVLFNGFSVGDWFGFGCEWVSPTEVYWLENTIRFIWMDNCDGFLYVEQVSFIHF